jgi:peptidyl-prolyl cis-trans isomerase SurA
MKKQLLIIPALFAGFCAAESTVVDRILVKVNDEIITQSDLNRQMEPVIPEIRARYKGDRLAEETKKVEKQALDMLIEEKLLYQKAVEMDYYTRAEPKVASYVQRVMKEKGYKDEEELEQALLKQGMSLREFREEVQKQISIEELKGDFIGSRITILKPEIEKYYKDHIADYTTPAEVSLSEIIIPAGGGSREAEDRAKDIYSRLQRGEESFANLASQYSKGPTANKGGDIGAYQVDKLTPEMAKAIANYKEGESTKPQLLREGYAIFHIDSRKAAVVRPLEEVRDQIRDKIGDARYEPEFTRFIAQLKEDAYVDYLPEIK